MCLCDVCFGLMVYKHEKCVACKGAGTQSVRSLSQLPDPYFGGEVNIYHEMFVNKYQHLVDENKYLFQNQREILRILLTSDSFFIPFAFDGDWEYVYSLGKVSLVAKLLKGNWNPEILGARMEDDVYILEIQFEEPFLINEFGVERFLNDASKKARGIEIYLPYHDYVRLYKSSLFEKSAEFWRLGINEEDLLEIHKEEFAPN